MKKFTPEFIERVRTACDMVDIIGEDTVLKRTGKHYMGLCPFPAHREKTASFCVTPDTGLYHCFGCNESGNIYNYLQGLHGFHFVYAIRYLAKRSGVALPKDTFSKSEEQQYFNRKKLLEVNALATDFFENNLKQLPPSHLVKKYLLKRGLLSETLEKFHIGYAPDKWDGLHTYLKKKQVPLSLALQLGLLAEKSGRVYDRFRNRLIFPIFSPFGKDVLGFGARTLGDDPAKYINSSESELFHKGKVLYGWHQAKNSIRDKDCVILVEGYTDVLSFYQKGVCNVVATMGTALTLDQARTISSTGASVLLCFDSDSAGQCAIDKSLPLLLNYCGTAPKIITLDKGTDPDSFIRKRGRLVLERRIKDAKDTILDKLLFYLDQVGTNEILLQKMVPLLVVMKNTSSRDYYVNRVIEVFGSDEKWAKKELNSMIKKALLESRKKQHLRPQTYDLHSKNIDIIDSHSQKMLSNPQSNAVISLAGASSLELSLLTLSLYSKENYLLIRRSKIMEKILHKGIRVLFAQLTTYKPEKQEHFSSLADIISAQVDHPQWIRIQHHPFLKYFTLDKLKIYLQDAVEYLEKKQQLLELKQLIIRMRVDKANSDKYLKKIMEIKRKNSIQTHSSRK